jgi:tetratricopeptide (TPR) repeat protein
VEGLAATAYNDNETYRDTVLRLIDLSEEGRKAVAERVRAEGVQRRDGGDQKGAWEHLRKAVAVTEELCANDKARMDRLAGMRGEVAGMQGGSGVGAAEAKTDLAFNLLGQGEYEKALELLKEALGIYQAELSEKVRGAGCSAAVWSAVWGRSGCNICDKMRVKVQVSEFCTGLSMQRWRGEAEGVEAKFVARSGELFLCHSPET